MTRLFSLLLLPSSALAQIASGEDLAQGSPYASLLPLVFIFVIFYFLLIRPQQKRMKEHEAMIAAVAKGDQVVTAGGIVGKVTRVDAGETLTVEIASGVEVAVVKTTLTNVLGKTPAKSSPADKKKGPSKNDNSAVSRDSVANDN